MSEHELTAHIYELETKLEEVSKDRDDWAKKYQELSKKNEVTYKLIRAVERAHGIGEKDE